MKVMKLTPDFCKEGRGWGEPAPTPRTDKEKMVKYWKNINIQQEKE